MNPGAFLILRRWYYLPLVDVSSKMRDNAIDSVLSGIQLVGYTKIPVLWTHMICQLSNACIKYKINLINLCWSDQSMWVRSLLSNSQPSLHLIHFYIHIQTLERCLIAHFCEGRVGILQRVLPT